MAKKNALTKLLQELDKEELIAEIEKICDKFDVVRDYFHIDLTGDTGTYVAQAKKKIEAQFYTREGKPRRPKASRLNKIIADFEVLSIYTEDTIQLLLFRTEQTLDFIDRYGYFQSALMQSTLRAFAKACTLITDNDLTDRYAAQCAATREKSFNVYPDGELVIIYDEHFNI